MFHRAKAAPGSPLAQARIAAHAAFDSLWKDGRMTRRKAYKWLAGELEISLEDCHMLFFDEATCARVKRLADTHLFRLTML